jgi:hypothetical protein
MNASNFVQLLKFGGLALLWAVSAASCNAGEPGKVNKMNENQNIEVINKSQNSGDLAVAVVNLARSNDPNDHAFLAQVLQAAEFLSRLDSEQDYSQPRNFLRVASVLDALEKNTSPSARELLIDLMRSPVFTETPSRVELLIEISESIRPAPPEVVEFWNRHSDPDDVYMNILMHALVQNGSQPALDVFEQKIGDDRYPEKRRIWWLRKEIPPSCNKILVLDCCSRMLQGGMNSTLKVSLVEVLFDFQSTWFRPSTPVTAAPLSSYGKAERNKLKTIGQYALQNLELPKTLKAALQDRLDELN